MPTRLLNSKPKIVEIIAKGTAASLSRTKCLLSLSPSIAEDSSSFMRYGFFSLHSHVVLPRPLIKISHSLDTPSICIFADLQRSFESTGLFDLVSIRKTGNAPDGLKSELECFPSQHANSKTIASRNDVMFKRRIIMPAKLQKVFKHSSLKSSFA